MIFIYNIKSFFFKLYLLFVYAGNKQKSYLKGDEKPFLIKFADLAAWMFRDNQFNTNYYAFGLNLKGTIQSEYIGRKEFLFLKHTAENMLIKHYGGENLSYDVITKDKFVTYAFFSSLGIPVVPVSGLVSNFINYCDGSIAEIEELLKFKTPFVLKNTVLEAGEGFLLCKPITSLIIEVNNQEISIEKFREKLKKGKWVIQSVVRSHEKIRKVNQTALNTTRIVTILNGEEPVFLTGFQSFATGNAEIDSWGKGAVYVGYDSASGRLKENGYFHPSAHQKAIISAHPDSGIVFKDYPIPYLAESIELCLKAHRVLNNNFVIGWDVVITDDGPFILEANEKPGMNAVQCIDGGLRLKIRDCYKSTVQALNG